MIIDPIVLKEGKDGSLTKTNCYSELLKERKVFLFSEVDDDLSASIVSQLLYLDSIAPGEEIKMYINSPGGSVSAGLAIYDTMQMIKSPVTTICAGLAASMGAVLLSGGEKGKRYSMKNGKILIHQVLGGVGGQATNMDIHTKDMLKTKRLLNGILAENTGKTMEDVTRDTERDYILNAEEAVAYGIIDGIAE